MTRAEMEQIADEAATKAIEKMFLTFGVDISKPEEVIAFQDDLRHVRKWRLSTEAAQAHALKTVVAVLVTGFLGWVGLLFWRH